jgi:hypothetical protein
MCMDAQVPRAQGQGETGSREGGLGHAQERPMCMDAFMPHGYKCRERRDKVRLEVERVAWAMRRSGLSPRPVYCG